MPNFVHPDIFTNGLGSIAARVSRAILIDVYSATYADVVGSLKVAEANRAAGNVAVADGAPSNSRKVTVALSGVAGGNAAKSAPDGTNMHVALVDDTADVVLLCCPESTDQAIISGNAVTFTADMVYTMTQPA